jgi:hypothetical protein
LKVYGYNRINPQTLYHVWHCEIDFENPERETMSLLMWSLLSLKNSGANSSMHPWLMMSILVDDFFCDFVYILCCDEKWRSCSCPILKRLHVSEISYHEIVIHIEEIFSKKFLQTSCIVMQGCHMWWGQSSWRMGKDMWILFPLKLQIQVN